VTVAWWAVPLLAILGYCAGLQDGMKIQRRRDKRAADEAGTITGEGKMQTSRENVTL
jgi:hypothetical protein